MSVKYLFPDRGWYEGKTVRDFCRVSLDNFDEIRINFDYYWFVEKGWSKFYHLRPSGFSSREDVFFLLMNEPLVIPEEWDGLPYSIAQKTVEKFFLPL